MKAQIVGIGQRRAGVSKRTGRPYEGIPVYVLMVSSDVEGYKPAELYFNLLSDVDFPPVGIGDLIDVDYSIKGYIEKVTVLKKAGDKKEALPC